MARDTVWGSRETAAQRFGSEHGTVAVEAVAGVEAMEAVGVEVEGMAEGKI
jgi:hypothetical protein